jgi:hypothetical protein
VARETAVIFAVNLGIPPESAALWWDDHDARGWVDSKGQPIRRWQSSLKGWAVRFGTNAKAFKRQKTGIPSRDY